MKRKFSVLLILSLLICLCMSQPVQAESQGVKLLALTFDDGPDAYITPQVLEALNQRNMRATFFMVGKWLPGKTNLIQSVAEGGHQIANHTFDHESLTGKTAAQIQDEVERCRAALEEITGQQDYMVRPPFGFRSPGVIESIPAPVILWSIDPAAGKQVPGDVMAQTILKQAKDGDIILMHDTTEYNLDATLAVLDTLHDRGFEFVTVKELFRLRGVTPQAGVAYKSVVNINPQAYDEAKLAQHWAWKDIQFMNKQGWMTGDAQGWHPNRYLTRAEAVVLLWRLAGSPKAQNMATGFRDVSADAWCAPAVAWAVEQGISQGKTAHRFGINDQITREQLYTLVERQLEDGVAATQNAENPTYGDDCRISDWAIEGVSHLRQLGFSSANDVELFRPGDPATRAETAELLHWYLKQTS